MPYIEDFSEFSKRMGCASIRDPKRDSFFIFENGATSDGQWKHEPPPEDRPELLRIQRTYYDERLRKLTNRYDSLRDAVATQADWYSRGAGPDPDSHFPNWRRKLKTDAKAIEKFQAKLAEIDEELARKSPDKFAQYQSRRADQLASAKETINELNQFAHYHYDDNDGGFDG